MPSVTPTAPVSAESPWADNLHARGIMAVVVIERLADALPLLSALRAGGISALEVAEVDSLMGGSTSGRVVR